MRILGIDLGDKKIGVALSDEMGWTAQGLAVIISGGGVTENIKRIKELALKNKVEKIVVGLPRNMDGSTGPRAEKAREFARRLEKSFGLPVEMWDERLTTAAAEKMLIKADLRRSKRRQVIDKIAAALILQNYLDAQSGKRTDGGGIEE
jgi:putative Holliday junction resolvase